MRYVGRFFPAGTHVEVIDGVAIKVHPDGSKEVLTAKRAWIEEFVVNRDWEPQGEADLRARGVIR